MRSPFPFRATPTAIIVGVGLAVGIAALILRALGAESSGLGLPLIAVTLICGGAGHAAGRGLLGAGQAGAAAIFGGLLMAAAIALALWAQFDPDGWRGFVVFSIMLASLCPAMLGLAIAAWNHLWGSAA